MVWSRKYLFSSIKEKLFWFANISILALSTKPLSVIFAILFLLWR